jgi:hypothetical protein
LKQAQILHCPCGAGEHIPPEAIQIQGPNYRESVIGNGLLSRNRAELVLLAERPQAPSN